MRKPCASALTVGAFLLMAQAGIAQRLPRLTIDDLQYEGAFRLSAQDHGASSLNYNTGPIAFHAANQSLFIAGHNHHNALAEFPIVELRGGTQLNQLAMSEAPTQDFSRVLERVAENPQGLDKIGGLYVYDTGTGPELLVNAYEYYDAPADNTHTSFVVRNANALSTSPVDGFFSLVGAAHASGWFSEIPAPWQAALGGTHLTGASSGPPINARFTQGPSAFVFDPSAFHAPTPGVIPTTPLLDFSLEFPLHEDHNNETLANDLWTNLSQAVYGMIVPGTRTYLTVGHSGGHRTGVCYKCTPDDGVECPGYCAPDTSDYDHYYWLWDVEEMIAVRNGERAAHSLRPYEYGALHVPFETRQLGGGTYARESGLLYLTVQRADLEQGPYFNPPVVVAYSFDLASLFADGFETGNTLRWE